LIELRSRLQLARLAFQRVTLFALGQFFGLVSGGFREPMPFLFDGHPTHGPLPVGSLAGLQTERPLNDEGRVEVPPTARRSPSCCRSMEMPIEIARLIA